MKQPELGKKILQLRQEKGFTQEELVEQCNISVRTIQRIEAGEVTPRSFTVKTILEALDSDLAQFQAAESKAESGLKKLMLLKIDDSKQANFLTKQFTWAWIAGIMYLVLGFIEVPADWARFDENEMLIPTAGYVVLKLIVLAAIILLYRGFILCGNILDNYFLKITSFILISLHVFFYGYDIMSLVFKNDAYFDAILIAQSIVFGVVGILFGIAVLRLHNTMGTIATVTGIFEIIMYAMFATVILALGGFIMLLPTTILEIVLLYKVATLVKEKQASLAT